MKKVNSKIQGRGGFNEKPAAKSGDSAAVVALYYCSERI